VTDLRLPEEKSRSGGPGVTFSQQVIGSPADGWGVAPDGRVAVVRAKPYRVDWVSRDGKTTVGPVIAYDVLPMTDADRQARVAKARSEPSIGAGVGSDGSHPMVEKPALEFAATKPPFAAGDVLVSPDAMVWVRRTSPSDAADAIYDVFDAAGMRTDRVAVAADEWVVGFGRGAIFVRAHGPLGTEVLRKYLIK